MFFFLHKRFVPREYSHERAIGYDHTNWEHVSYCTLELIYFFFFEDKNLKQIFFWSVKMRDQDIQEGEGNQNTLRFKFVRWGEVNQSFLEAILFKQTKKQQRKENTHTLCFPQYIQLSHFLSALISFLNLSHSLSLSLCPSCKSPTPLSLIQHSLAQPQSTKKKKQKSNFEFLFFFYKNVPPTTQLMQLIIFK